MATVEEIKKKIIEESNDLLSEQINLTSKLNDEMSFILKIFKEKGTLDKQSLDLTKEASRFAKSLSSEYVSLNDVKKDIAKNEKLQNDIQKQTLSLYKQGGESLKDELKLFKTKEESLTKAQNKIAKMESDKKLGKIIDEDLYTQAQNTLTKKQEQLKVANEILTPEAAQIRLLEQTGQLLNNNNEYLEEHEQKQKNLAKSQSLFTSVIGGTANALNKLGFGNLSKKIGLDDAKKKAEEMTYVLTEGGKKSLGVFGKMRVAAASFGAALKSALGPLALLGMAVSLVKKGTEKFKENAEAGLRAMTRLSEESTGLARTLGISQGKAEGVAAAARSMGSAMGMTTGMATKSAEAIYGAMSGVEKQSDNTLKTFMKLNVFAGMSAESLEQMRQMAKLTGQDAGVVATKMADTARSSIIANKVNISMKEVMVGVSKQSNEMKLNFGGSAEGLTKAFVKAKSLGFELEKVKGISQSLLNIEDSIAAEMEAELLTGKDLNLEKAREAALNHDVSGLMDEIAKNYGSVADFQKMNVIQQEAAAKAIGMSSEELANTLAGNKANKSENQQLLEVQKKSLDAMTSQASMQEKIQAREEAKDELYSKSAKTLEKMNEFMARMAEKFGPILEAVFAGISDIFFDIVGSFEKGTDKLGNMESITVKIQNVFTEIRPIIKQIVGALMDFATGAGPIIWNVFKGILKTVTFITSSIGKFFNLFTKGNKDLNVTKALLGGIATAILLLIGYYKIKNNLANGLNKATIKELGGQKKLKDMNVLQIAQARIKQALGMSQVAVKKKEGQEIDKNTVKENKGLGAKLRGLLTTVYDYAANAAKAVAGIPFVGPVLAVAALGAAVAGGMMLYNKVKGDDVMSGPNQRTLFAGKDQISLNADDTVIAGTDLFGKKKSNRSEGSDNSALVSEMQAIKSILQSILSKEGGVFIDGNKVGSTLALTSYKTQ